MKRYLLKRILLLIPTLIGITFITFLIMKLAPGDPTMMKLMFSESGLSPDALAAYLKSKEPVIELPEGYIYVSEKISTAVHGPDKVSEQPIFKSLKWVGENAVFYGKWVGSIAMLDFGLSVKDKRPVTTKIMEALPITLLINILTIVIVYLISIPLGIWSALKKGAVVDQVVMLILFIFYSLPGFWVMTMLLMFFAGGEYLDMFPLMGWKSDHYQQLGFFGRIADIGWHLVLPVLASTIGSFAFLSRFTRSTFLDVVGQDYVRTARAKGIDERKVLYKHALRNSLIPFVTLMGTLLPALLGGSVIIEQICNIPGMGMLSFEAILSRDHNVIMGIATISAFLTLVSLLITDLMYVVVDPRIRLD